MKSENSFHIVNRTALHNRPCSLSIFLSWLKNQFYSSRKFFSVFLQIYSSSQKGRCMPVMSTGMHQAWIFGTIRTFIQLLHLQGIDVSPQANYTVFTSSPYQSHCPRLTCFFPGNSVFIQIFTNILCCLKFFHTDFRILMQMSSYFDQFCLILNCLFVDAHRFSSLTFDTLTYILNPFVISVKNMLFVFFIYFI